MKKYSLMFVLGLTAIGLATSPAEAAIEWSNSMTYALQQAKAQNKPILVSFYTTWCGWCKKLDAETYTDPRVMAAAQRYITVKLNAEGDGASEKARLGVKGYPNIVFLRPDGSEIERFAGYLGPADFASELARIGGKVDATGAASGTPAAAPEAFTSGMSPFETLVRQQDALQKALANRNPKNPPRGVLLAQHSIYNVASNGLILAYVLTPAYPATQKAMTARNPARTIVGRRLRASLNR
jgi:thioredoxin-related protein